jgi:hypothetical protein
MYATVAGMTIIAHLIREIGNGAQETRILSVQNKYIQKMS